MQRSPTIGASDFRAFGTTPLSAIASKNRSTTALPCRRFESEMFSFGKCACPYKEQPYDDQRTGNERLGSPAGARTELSPMGRCNAGQPKAFSRHGTHGMDCVAAGGNEWTTKAEKGRKGRTPPSRTRIGSAPHSS